MTTPDVEQPSRRHSFSDFESHSLIGTSDEIVHTSEHHPIPVRFKHALHWDDAMREEGSDDHSFVEQLMQLFQKSSFPVEGVSPRTPIPRIPNNATAWKEFARRRARGVLSSLVFLQWLPKYSWRESLRGDVSAGLTIAAMLVPQGMAYSMVANLPPIYGLYTAFVPQIVYALTGTSKDLSVGPVAILSLLQAAGLEPLASPKEVDSEGVERDNDYYVQLAITTAFLVGITQYLMSVLKLGFLVNFLSHPVISGFTSASAIIIALSQIGHVFGYSFVKEHEAYKTFYNLVSRLDKTHWPSLVMGIIAFGIILFMRRVPKLRRMPSALVVVLLATIVTWGAKLGPPVMDPIVWLQLFPTALAMSLIGYMESTAVAKIYAAKNKYTIDPNQDLFALGVANLIGSLFSSYPSTGSFSRTAVNSVAGAKTLVSALICAATILFVLLLLTPLFHHLPKPVLGSIVLAAVMNLIDTKEPRYLWRVSKGDLFVLVATFVLVLTIGVEIGLMIAVGISMFLLVVRSVIPTHAVLGRLPGTNVFRNILRFPTSETKPGVLIYRFDKDLHFANVGRFIETLEHLFTETQSAVPIKAMVLDFSGVVDLDSTAVHALSECFTDCQRQGQRIFVANAKGPCRDMLKLSGLAEIIGSECILLNIEDAVSRAETLVQMQLTQQRLGAMASSVDPVTDGVGGVGGVTLSLPGVIDTEERDHEFSPYDAFSELPPVATADGIYVFNVQDQRDRV